MEKQIKEIANAMKDINLLSSYDLDKSRILSYATKLIELYPEIEPKVISELMDSFFRCKKDFIPSRGIRNFTEHLEKTKQSKKMQEIAEKIMNGTL